MSTTVIQNKLVKVKKRKDLKTKFKLCEDQALLEFFTHRYLIKTTVRLVYLNKRFDLHVAKDFMKCAKKTVCPKARQVSTLLMVEPQFEPRLPGKMF